MQWLRQRIHPTWLFTVLCYGVLGGIALAQIWQVSIWGFLIIGVILLITGWLVQRKLSIAIVLVAGLCIGLARGGWGQQQQSVYRDLYRKHVALSGVVADDVDITGHGTTLVYVRNVMIAGHTLPGKLFATVTGGERLKRSDRITLDGVIDQGFGSVPATFTGKVTSVTRESGSDVPRDVRDTFASYVRQAIREPESSLGIGYLLGQKNALPDDIVTALKVTALTHIVVASGYNLTILVRIGRRLFARISRYLATLTSVSLIVGFIAMTGMSPSMTRAGLISLLSLWAWYVGRKFHPVTLLGLAAVVTALINPSYVWGDLGWLLSFAAFAGVMIIAPVVSAYFFGDDVPFVGQVLVETASAQLATLPIMIMAFQQFSIIGLFANLLVLPLVPLAMLLVAVSGIGAWVSPASFWCQWHFCRHCRDGWCHP